MTVKPKPKGGGAMGGAAIGLGTGGLLIASQLGTAAINAGAAAGTAAIAADALKDLFNKPEALMVVGGVVLAFFLLK
jgi:hypothetical protein